MMIQQAQVQGDLSGEAWYEPLDISPSGYYAWREREVSPRQQADARFGEELEHVFVGSRHTSGSRRSRKRVDRLMLERGLYSVHARKWRVGLTKAGQRPYFVPNLLNQDFEARDVNEKWVTDTTYIPTHEGWLYLVSVIDLFSR